MGNTSGAMRNTLNKDGDLVQYGYNYDNGIFLTITKKDDVAADAVAADAVAANAVAADEVAADEVVAVALAVDKVDDDEVAVDEDGDQTSLHYYTGESGRGVKIDMTEMHIMLKEQGIPTMEIMDLRRGHMNMVAFYEGFTLGANASLGNLDNASDQKPDEEDEPEGHKPEGDKSSEEKATSMTVPEESTEWTLPIERSEWVKWRSEEMEQTAKKPIELCNICNFIAEMSCVSCRAIEYCSKNCQARDWKVHKVICKSLANPPPNPFAGSSILALFFPVTGKDAKLIRLPSPSDRDDVKASLEEYYLEPPFRSTYLCCCAGTDEERCFVANFYGQPQMERFGVNKSIQRAMAGVKHSANKVMSENLSLDQDPDKTWKGPVVVLNIANGGPTLPESLEFGDIEPKDFAKVIEAMTHVPLNLTAD